MLKINDGILEIIFNVYHENISSWQITYRLYFNGAEITLILISLFNELLPLFFMICQNLLFLTVQLSIVLLAKEAGYSL